MPTPTQPISLSLEPAPEAPEDAAENGAGSPRQGFPTNSVTAPPQPDAGSPTSVREHEQALTVRWAHLSEALPPAVGELVLARERVASIKAEMESIRRLLVAHQRIREPRRKRVAP